METDPNLNPVKMRVTIVISRRSVFRLSPPPEYNPSDEVLDTINHNSHPVKIIMEYQDTELTYSHLETVSHIHHGECHNIEIYVHCGKPHCQNSTVFLMQKLEDMSIKSGKGQKEKRGFLMS